MKKKIRVLLAMLALTAGVTVAAQDSGRVWAFNCTTSVNKFANPDIGSATCNDPDVYTFRLSQICNSNAGLTGSQKSANGPYKTSGYSFKTCPTTHPYSQARWTDIITY